MTNDRTPDDDLVRDLTALLMADERPRTIEDLLAAVSW